VAPQQKHTAAISKQAKRQMQRALLLLKRSIHSPQLVKVRFFYQSIRLTWYIEGASIQTEGKTFKQKYSSNIALSSDPPTKLADMAPDLKVSS
jgi:hypothetical protein